MDEENELIIAHSLMQSELFEAKGKLKRTEDDLAHIDGQKERAVRGEKTHLENLKTLIKSPVISLKAFKDAQAGLQNFRKLQSSLSEKREKLMKTCKQLKDEIPKLREQVEDLDTQLGKLERIEEQKVIKVDFRNDKPGST